MSDINRKVDYLVNALYGAPSGTREDLSELRRDLTSYGVRIDELDHFVSGMLRQADEGWKALPAATRAIHEKSRTPAWVNQAQAKRRAFEEKLRGLSRGFDSTREFVQAVLNGNLGVGIQQHAQVFFRNQDWRVVSEGDLISLLQDFKLLDEIDAEKTKAKAPVTAAPRKGTKGGASGRRGRS